MGMVRGKDDHIDSQRIAEYAYMRKENLKHTKLPSEELIKVQNLLAMRERMVRQKAGYQASLGEYKRVLVQQQQKDLFLLLNNMISALKKQILKADKILIEIIQSNKKLMNTYTLLTSIKGIGVILAANIMVTTICFTKFNDSRKYACYCGTAPFKYSSGTSLKGRTKVSQMANKKMKALFNLAALSAIRHDPELKLYFDKRKANGANGMSTINIIRNKIIHSSSKLLNIYTLLTSIKGIGVILAANIMVTTICFTKFNDSRKYACYCGTAPFKYSSGTSINGRTKVSQMANKKMKALFNLAALSAIQHDPELKLYFDNRMANGANGMSTINIIRNKIIHRVFAVVKRGTPYVVMAKYAA